MGLEFPEAAERYFTGQAMKLFPKVRGLVDEWEVQPELPPGLRLNARKGIISGVPTEVLPEGSWTVTARNSEGADSATLGFAVLIPPPSMLAYPTLAKEFAFSALPLLKRVAISPTVEGTVDEFSVSTPLPPGLELDPETGVISGIARELAERATYEVTASNSTGSTSLGLVFSVQMTRPEALSFPQAGNLYVLGETVSLSPDVQGVVTAWTVEPALPAGLTLDAMSGAIRGVPQDTRAAVTYEITAANEAGATSVELRFAVSEPAPQGLSFPGAVTEYVVGQEVYLEPQLEVGFIDRFSVEPELPEGLYLDPTSGIISGSPAAEASAETYGVTGHSKSGSTVSVELTFACLEPVTEATGVTQRFAATIEEITDIADMVEEPGKNRVLGDWMVWMVHRVHLNDPSLTDFNFNNLWMPVGHAEPRIAPKLMKALANNTHVTSLQLAHSNLQKPEGRLLAESLRQNSTLQILNLESNSLDSDAVRAIALALHQNSESSVEVWRFNNQKHIGQYFGRPVEQAVGEMMEKNTRITKLGFACNDANWRLMIDRAMLRNTDYARRRRKGADVDVAEETVAQEKRMSRIVLTSAPSRAVSEVFGEGDLRMGLVRKNIVEHKRLPTHQALQAWAKGQGEPLPYSAVAPLMKSVRAKVMDAAISQQVNVVDAYGAEMIGTLRAWCEKNESWSIDVWRSSDERFNFTADHQPIIEVSDSFRAWLQAEAAS